VPLRAGSAEAESAVISILTSSDICGGRFLG
jgi:hypothetical protein